MKKIEKILLAFVFMVVGSFGIGNVKANTYDVKIDNQYYEYYLVSGNNKLEMNVVSDSLDKYKEAAAKLFNNEVTSGVLNIVPIEFKVKSGMTWDSSTDSATMYINIPLAFNLDKSEKIYLVKFKTVDGEIRNTVYYLDSSKNRVYEIKDYNDVKSAITSSNVKSFGKIDVQNYFSNKYAVLNTSNFESTGSSYYMLITCSDAKVTTTTTTTTTTKSTTTTTTTTKPGETTTTTIPNETTTTIENPKTYEVNNQLYIVIGIIALAGIVGLGVKFAKASK